MVFYSKFYDFHLPPVYEVATKRKVTDFVIHCLNHSFPETDERMVLAQKKSHQAYTIFFIYTYIYTHTHRDVN